MLCITIFVPIIWELWYSRWEAIYKIKTRVFRISKNIHSNLKKEQSILIIHISYLSMTNLIICVTSSFWIFLKFCKYFALSKFSIFSRIFTRLDSTKSFLYVTISYTAHPSALLCFNEMWWMMMLSFKKIYLAKKKQYESTVEYLRL